MMALPMLFLYIQASDNSDNVFFMTVYFLILERIC